MPGPASPRPAGADAFQVVPSGDVQITTSCWPGVVPTVPVPAKPPSAAASAVTCMLPAVIRVVPAGIGRSVSFQLAPPSADWTANGTRPAAGCAIPIAPLRRPFGGVGQTPRVGGPGGGGGPGGVPGLPAGSLPAGGTSLGGPPPEKA